MGDENTNGSRNKAFTSMLTNTLRNHYTLNQMVDRKARIILSVNVVILSFIIGRIIGNTLNYNPELFLLVSASAFCLVSIVYSILAIMPENQKQELTVQLLKSGELNPIYYGNYLSMSSESFENSMIEMSGDTDFSHRTMLKDIYHIGELLERKRKFLRYSLISMLLGICISLVLSLAFRILFI